MIFPDHLIIRKALEENQPDARGSGRSFSEATLATYYAGCGGVEGLGLWVL
jgi:hypothetical protein